MINAIRGPTKHRGAESCGSGIVTNVNVGRVLRALPASVSMIAREPGHVRRLGKIIKDTFRHGVELGFNTICKRVVPASR